jgi:sporulation related protein
MGISRAWIGVAIGALLSIPAYAGPPEPSEEMTAEELATIPEPVPALPRAPGSALWRVQVFATQDPVLADRIAQEARRTLDARAYVSREAAQYKVRLGDYASEGEALELKAKAVRSGFPGAFRIRCAIDPTLNKP